jgi:hypothetical protein
LVIGIIADTKQAEGIKPFTTDIFKGFLDLFLLEMGMVTAKRIGAFRKQGIFLSLFAVLAPAINGSIVAFAARLKNDAKDAKQGRQRGDDIDDAVDNDGDGAERGRDNDDDPDGGDPAGDDIALARSFYLSSVPHDYLGAFSTVFYGLFPSIFGSWWHSLLLFQLSIAFVGLILIYNFLKKISSKFTLAYIVFSYFE